VAVSAGVVERLGGAERLRVAGLARVEPMGDGVWLQASDDVDAMSDEQLARVRGLFAPVLLAGPRAVEDLAEEPRLRL
jgi:hypothetical protein